MNRTLFLFCGGPAIYGEGLPKPLMHVSEGESLILFYLKYLKNCKSLMPNRVILLCDDNQEHLVQSELEKLEFPIPISVRACGRQPSTFKKFEIAVSEAVDQSLVAQFSYPDVFCLGEPTELFAEAQASSTSVFISASPLKSRFPSLIVDVYNNVVKGISNYSSALPANPHYVFGGDFWGPVGSLKTLADEFKLQVDTPEPSLEFDFFFWLINQKKMGCTILRDDRIWVDSNRDVHNLLARHAKII